MSVRLSEHLPLLASAPDGIKKLRRLILELAVRGKIVPVDELESETTTLGAVGKWAVGSGFPTSEQGKTGLEILFAKVSDMNLPENTKFITTTNHTISRESAKRLKVNIHPAGTVVFPKIGGAIATNKRRILVQGTAIDNNCLGITPKAGVDSEWLFVLLSSMDLTKYQAGTSVPALAQGVLSEIPVLLPPEAEQHRIVAKVDELMALCDRMEAEQADAEAAHATLVQTLLGTLTQSRDAGELAANWQRLSQHFDTLFATEASLDALKQTILQLAVMGKLVPQDPNDEPVSELLKRIAAEKARLGAEGKIKKDKPLPPVGEEEKPFELPVGWAWVRLADLLPAFQNGVSSRGDAGGEQVIVLRLADIKDGAVSLADTRQLPIERSAISKYQLEESDILIVRVNGSADIVGRFVVVEDVSKAIYCDHFIRLRISKDLVIPRFLSLVAASKLVRDKIGDLFITTAGQKTVNQGHIGSLPIPLVSTAEQHRIVAKVDELMALCDSLKADLAESRARQARLATTLIESALQAA